MNIVLLGHDDFPSLFALARLVRIAPAHAYTAFLSGDDATSGASVPALAELAAIDRQSCARLRKSGGLPAPIARAPVLPEPNSVAGLAVMRRVEPDVIVSVRYRRILRDDAIAIPRHGVLNLHSGILPDYKGVMATFWAMLHREAEIGATLHRIVDSGIDTGPVLGICRMPARYDESYLANVLRLYSPGCDMLAAALECLASGKAPETRSQVAGGRYFSTPRNEDIERFNAAGLRLADGSEFKAPDD